jgi:hypothetical protein
VDGRLPEAALVPGDTAELAGEGMDLGCEHGVVHQEAMAEDDGRTRAAGVFEVDVLTVDVGKRHRATP